MSLFDDQNDDSILEIPIFRRIKTTTNVGTNPFDDSLPSISKTTEDPIETTDKSNETFTLDSDSDEEHKCKDWNHSSVGNDVSNDSIQVLYCSPTDPNEDRPQTTDNKPNDWNCSLNSINDRLDWTPIKPNFINRTPFQKKVQNRSKSSVKKSINILNKKQLFEQKVNEKEDKNKEKNERKAQKELSKARDKAQKEVLRSQTIGQSIRYCFAVIDRQLYESNQQFIDEEFERNECNYRLTDSPVVPSSVTWIRKCLNLVDSQQTEQSSGQSSQISVGDTEVQQNHILVVIESNDFIQRVHSFVTQSGETLFDFVRQVVQKSGIKNITLLVSKLEQYFKRQKTKSQNEFKQRFNELNSKQTNSNQNCRQNRRFSMPSVAKEDVDLALIDMEFKLNQFDSQSKVSVIKAKDSSEISVLIYRFTRSVAEALVRKEKRSQQNIGWFADADNRNTVDPTDAQSHHKLWRKQLMEFSKVSYDIANAITSQYPTPLSLLDSYSRQSNPELLLSDIVVSRRQLNGNTTERKVGRELSTRIHLFMTSKTENLLLNNQ